MRSPLFLSLSLSFSLFLSLSISFSDYLPTTYLPTYLPTSLPPYLPTSLPPYLPTSLPPYLPTSLPPYLPTSLPPYLPTSRPPDLPTSLPPYLPTSLPPCLPTYLPTYLPTTYLPTYPPTHPPSYLPTDNIKNETILRDVLQKWTVECRADGLEPMRFAFFPVHLSKVLRCHEKVMPGHMPLVLRLPRKMHLCRSSSNVPRLPSFLEMLQNPHVLLTFDKVRNPLRLPREATSEPPKVVRTPTACTFSTSQLPKVVPAWCVFNILTSKSASRHNGVHFFDISTSKSGPNLLCFVHFDFEVCFAPQQRALSRHLNFQKWSKNGVLCTF